MGRRKERRIAANAGRRVKLDLFAEPSGDLGSSSAQDAVGGEGDTKIPAELPSSPSSSATDQQNPLLLLEQYSDDELDEGSNEGHNRAGLEDASVGIDDEGKMAAQEEAEDIEKIVGVPTTEKVEQVPADAGSASQDHFQKLEKGSITEIESDDVQRGSNKIEEATYSAAPDEQLVGDVSSGWKMVLHEESNQYYYWNILTGETSWDVPDVLAQETMTSVDHAVGDTEGKRDAVEEDHNSSRKLNIDSKDSLQTSDAADEGMKVDASNDGSKGDRIGEEEWNRDASQNHDTSLLGRHSGENQSHSDLSLQLIKQCENLLERLSDAESLNCNQEGQDIILKYKLEIGIRLADVKALASHGSSLLPFWVHSVYRLKQLEAAIADISQHQSPASRFEATVESREGIGHEIGSSENKALLPSIKSHGPDYSEKSVFDAHNGGSTTTEHAPLACYPSMSPVDNMGEESETNGIREEGEVTPGSAEDVDMDVDMEVEDAFTTKSSAHYSVSTEIPNLQSTFVNQETTTPGQLFSAPVEEWIPPPPPDNEPFPPPPPDDEPFPPPPPDEPPEILYPISSNLESVQPFPYSEQYHLSYPGSGLEYYGQANIEPPGTTLYTHQEGGQVAISHLPQYYDTVPNMYTVAPLVVNPVDSNAHYGIQSETMNPVSLVSSVPVDSLGTQSQHVADHVGTAAIGLVGLHADAGSNLLPKTNLDIMSEHGSVKAPPELPDVRPSIGAPSTSAMNSVSIPSTSDNPSSISSAAAIAAAAAAATATTSKVQSKVPRGKKRAVAVVSTLRSNKKVSSLVDKWKAAKEELQEEEEEPEDAYEILEKKRQREIEEWRAQQIASGEAKDNANFQPLGGDWRERVKRKRAQKMKETGQSSSDVTDANQQPNVLELSKGLPSGWQAYWDESSKQVYYGNVLTSKTTWTRPAD